MSDDGSAPCPGGAAGAKNGILNGAYLVRRPEAAAFAELARSHDGALALEVTGPWPPYHFAEARA